VSAAIPLYALAAVTTAIFAVYRLRRRQARWPEPYPWPGALFMGAIFGLLWPSFWWLYFTERP
jgi:uncharacterized membrane protein YfcA